MTTETLTLRDFLSARIDSDEAQARNGWITSTSLASRVLAECEVRRGIIGAAGAIQDALDRKRGQFGEKWRVEEILLRAVAAVYSDHPDYREEWRP